MIPQVVLSILLVCVRSELWVVWLYGGIVVCVDTAALMSRTWCSRYMCKIQLYLCQFSLFYVSSIYLGHSRKILSLPSELFP